MELIKTWQHPLVLWCAGVLLLFVFTMVSRTQAWRRRFALMFFGWTLFGFASFIAPAFR